MSWRDIKIDGDIITAVDHNNMVIYTTGHQQQHQVNGEQPIDHNLLLNYADNRHRSIYFNSLCEWVEIEF